MPRLELKRISGVWLVGIACGSAALGLAWHRNAAGRSASLDASTKAPLLSARSLLALGTQDLSSLEIGRMNLCCAEGLPNGTVGGSADLSATLEAWAKQVASETTRNLSRFHQNPAEYNQSEAYFRILVLVTVLQQDCGIRYNPERVQAPDFSDARDLFLHGLLSGQHQGTCVSMPVLYVAIGRRLGYPLKLVAAKAHLFARWESADGKERFNIEATRA